VRCGDRLYAGLHLSYAIDQPTEQAYGICGGNRRLAWSLQRAGEHLYGLSMGRKHTYATKTQLETLVWRMHRTGILYYEALEEFKKQFILVVLRDVNWNKSKAARVLQMHRSTLVRILRELNIDVGIFRNAERRLPYGIGMRRRKQLLDNRQLSPEDLSRRRSDSLNASTSTALILDT
jgi:Fis family transcriptional regulator, factor for inversion stimulation protein